jgi:hypothetical protein
MSVISSERVANPLPLLDQASQEDQAVGHSRRSSLAVLAESTVYPTCY